MQPKYFESLYPEVTRDKELTKIVGYIQEGVSSQIVGLPGSGRANILGLLAYNKVIRLKHFPTRHGIVHFVMVNFSEVKRRPYTDVIKFLFLCLGNSLRDRELQEEYEKVDSLFKDALSYNDELVFSQGLKNAVEYLAVERKLSLIFLFDRFDDYVPQVTDDFFTLLRSLRDRAKYRFSVVFSLARPLEETLEAQLLVDFSDFIAGHVIYVSLFDEASVEFRITYLEKLTKKLLPKEQKEEVIRLTGGHIRLTKVSIEALLAEDIVEDVEEFLYKQQTVQAALLSIWKSLTPAEQAYFIDKTGAADNYLQQVGLVKEEEITLPLFKRAIKESLFRENEGKLLYDDMTHAIKKGEQVISDSLTKAEFRFLRYLLQHQDEVVDRDTIIATVWLDDASTEGVTEQAIDQLIFRLRRKIEENPTLPVHLLTVKGRGVRFTQ